MKTFQIFSLLIISTLFFSCTDESDNSVKPGITINPNTEELITTVQIHLSDTNHVIIDTVAFNDPDGDGGNPPTIDTLMLQAGQSYLVNLKFIDASNPLSIKDITAEIEIEADEHLVCFDQTNIAGISINKADSDGNYELGLKSKWKLSPSASSNNGILKLTLKHQPDVKDGTCTPGDTDVEINFPVIIN
ncbi:MAG: hypothetical protein KDB74_10575 [Flavobacteriales bacterium]|nr:hypothetical protein [Flavobacteriales bacterium]